MFTETLNFHLISQEELKQRIEEVNSNVSKEIPAVRADVKRLEVKTKEALEDIAKARVEATELSEYGWQWVS